MGDGERQTPPRARCLAWETERSREGEKSRRSPAQVMVNVLGGCVRERAANQIYSTGRRREEAAGAFQRSNRRCEGGAQRVNRYAGGNEGAGVPGRGSCFCLPPPGVWCDGETANAPHRTGRRRSRARPRFRITQRAGAYPSMVRRRESRARSQANSPGRGWTLQFSGLETLEKARQRIQLFTLARVLGTPRTVLLPLPAPIVCCHTAQSEWPFRCYHRSPTSATDPG